MSGSALRAALVVLLVACPGRSRAEEPGAEPSLILTKPGSAHAQLVRALFRALARLDDKPRVVELSGDGLADGARVAREAKDVTVLFAVGPDATEVAGDAHGPAVVSLGVPNPARVRTPGAYVSIYPSLDGVLGYVGGVLGAKRAGLLFTPSRNREVALAFLKAGETAGVAVQPIPVGSAGDLVRDLKKGLSDVDVLLLAVDPILFDKSSLEFIVRESREARKPTVGFIEELRWLGVTLCLVAPAEATADAAVEAAREPVRVGKRRIEVGPLNVIVSREAAAAVGLDPEGVGATKQVP